MMGRLKAKAVVGRSIASDRKKETATATESQPIRGQLAMWWVILSGIYRWGRNGLKRR